jgi:predicted enzyme related to lactoylglutathione lyase
MSELAEVPAGSGKHPILMVAIAAGDLAASVAFYRHVFGWQTHAVTPEITVALAGGGPVVSLRANSPAGFPGMVPFIRVPDIDAALADVAAAGGALERAPWSVPMGGTLARFTDPSGTIYGLTNAMAAGDLPRIRPFTADQPPATASICAIEMYAADGAAAARFFRDLFGWGSLETMPQYMSFDPGAGIGGVFQSHTPANPAVAYISMPDVRATIDRIAAAGGRPMGEPMAVPGLATFGYFADPSGTMMGLIGA